MATTPGKSSKGSSTKKAAAKKPKKSDSDRLAELDGLIPLLPALPAMHEPAIELFPGEYEGAPGEQLFVRRTPVIQEDAPRAVYVHGLGGSSANWTDLMYLLAPSFPGIAMDLPGFGFSDPPAGNNYSIPRHSEAVIETIERDGNGPVHLFGNSMGGAISIHVAAHRPDLVRTLTLISPALPNQRPMPAHGAIAAQGLPLLPRMFGFSHAQMSAEDRVQMMYSWCFADQKRLRQDRYEATIAETERRTDLAHSLQAFIGSSRGLSRTFLPHISANTWKKAKMVQAPTLAIFGAQDQLVDCRVSTRVGTNFSESMTVIMSDVGHVAQMETPERVAKLVLQRLADLGERYT